jgi:hypothetical protein
VRPRSGHCHEALLLWAGDHFALIRFDDEAPTIGAILEKARAAVMRHGIRGLVIDPYNEIEHRRPGNMSETRRNMSARFSAR